jgi:hypothetical protein
MLLNYSKLRLRFRGVNETLGSSFPNIRSINLGLHIFILCSLRILILTPWSEKKRDKNVESLMPGKALALYTVNGSDVTEVR